MSRPLIVIDADVLGRRRTGDESYVANLLRELPQLGSDFRFAAVTRHPELVPCDVEPVELPAKSQLARMSFGLPRLLRRLDPALAHFQYAIPLRFEGRAAITVHDLSFERARELTSYRDRWIFRRSVRRSVKKAAVVLTVSEFSRSELCSTYGLQQDRVIVTPNGVDPAFLELGRNARASPGTEEAIPSPYVLFVGALQPRKDPVCAVQALALSDPDLRLVLAGPDKGSADAVVDTASRLGIRDRVQLLGHVDKPRLAFLYRQAACLVFPSRYEGFGLPVLEAMALGTPVVAAATSSIPEVAGDAAILVEPTNPVALAGGIERALADRDRLVRAGLKHAGTFTWASTARLTLEAYRVALS